MFDFKNKVAVVTGGARGIGRCISEKVREAGATVCVIDLLPNDYFVGDLANKETLERFAEKVIADFGHVDYLINNAAPKMVGITNGSYEDFEYAQRVGVTAPFYYEKGIKKCIQQLKFNGKEFMAYNLARDMANAVKTDFKNVDFDSICFVPFTISQKIRRT